MKFGFPLFAVSPRSYADVARLAEERGFESIWLPEHLIFPATMPATYPYTDDGQPGVTPETPLYDPWVVLAFIAAVTSNLRLATQVFVLPLRHPIPVARSLVTLDRVSGGRVTLGAGVGWLEEEFAAVGQSFGDRGRRTDEMVDVIRRLFREDVVEHHGEFYDFDPVAFRPKPLQRRGIPIEFGASSGPALRRAGRLGDGWIEIGCPDIAEFERRLAIVLEARRSAGREHAPFEVSTGSTLASDADSIKRAQDAGVTRVIIGPEFTGGAFTLDEIERWADGFAARVMSQF